MHLVQFCRKLYELPILCLHLQGATKSSPLKLFCCFLSNPLTFLKFYNFFTETFYIQLPSKNMILLKNDDVIDFLTQSPTDFSAIKMFKLKMLFNFHKPVTTLLPMTLQ